MSTMIEEIRKRIKAASDNTDEAGDYDEYATGQGVGLATALQIIDEVGREHPVPADVEEAAEMAARRAYPYEGGTKGAICEASIPIFCKGFKAGIAYERERLDAFPTIKVWMARDGHGSLVFSSKKPHRLELWKLWEVTRDTPAIFLPNTLFPDLRWKDEPKEVEIIIKEAKK